jgi:hypothetical protein
MKVLTSTLIGLLLVVSTVVVVSSAPSAKATDTDPSDWLTGHVVNCPDMRGGMLNGNTYAQYADYENIRTGNCAKLYGPRTGFQPNYLGVLWPQGNSRSMNWSDDSPTWPLQVMPPANATVHKVYAFAYIRANYSAWVGFGFFTNWDVQVASHPQGLYHTGYYAYPVGGGNWQSLYWDITDYTLNGTKINWTSILTGYASEVSVYLLYDFNDPINLAVDVDYLGFIYNYTLPGESSSSPSTDWDEIIAGSGTTTMSILGMFGFFGMIACPAIGIWIARHSGESKWGMLAKVMTAMAFCFGLFMWSIQG